MPLSLISLLT
uniref:Uncharacterized protein n=1 Tax=Rhizophora mucronata TaxID=61149 RepID=A0A2P2P742_RHIMU